MTGSNVTWQGGLQNFGEYRNDPSTQKFMSDLVVFGGGFLVGGVGDVFEIHTNLRNGSTQNMLWDTSRATLRFADDIDHSLSFRSEKLGGLDGQATAEIAPGLIDNFAWGEIDLGQGAGRLVYDPFSGTGNALYTSFFDIFVDVGGDLC